MHAHSDSATVIAAFSVGLAGCVYARVSGHQPLVCSCVPLSVSVSLSVF